MTISSLKTIYKIFLVSYLGFVFYKYNSKSFLTLFSVLFVPLLEVASSIGFSDHCVKSHLLLFVLDLTLLSLKFCAELQPRNK